MDTTWQASGPGLCLSLRVRRTTARGLAALVTAALWAALGSCTATVDHGPETPQPQTPTSSRDPGRDVGPQFVPSEPPSATVRFYDLHTREGSPCPSGTVERSCG